MLQNYKKLCKRKIWISTLKMEEYIWKMEILVYITFTKTGNSHISRTCYTEYKNSQKQSSYRRIHLFHKFVNRLWVLYKMVMAQVIHHFSRSEWIHRLLIECNLRACNQLLPIAYNFVIIIKVIVFKNIFQTVTQGCYIRAVFADLPNQIHINSYILCNPGFLE